MRRPKVLITTPYPTPEEIGAIFGMSKARIRHLTELADRIMKENDEKAARKAAGKKAAGNAAPRRQSTLLKESGSVAITRARK